MLAGKPKSGKSTAARDLALQVARGGSWLGFSCAPRPVIYVALEDQRTAVRRHFRGMGARGDEPLRFVFRDGAGDLVTRLRAVAATDRPGLIIVDTLQRAIKARDLNDYAEVTTKLTPILNLARETSAAVLLIHHAGKASREDAMDSVLGSTALAASVDNVFVLRRNDRYRTLVSIQRVGPDLPETVLELDSTGAIRVGATRREADDRHVETALIEALGSGPSLRRALLDSVEARQSEKLRVLKQVVDAGLVIRSGTGTKSDPYTYARAAADDDGSRAPTHAREPQSDPTAFGEISKVSAPNGGSDILVDGRSAGNHQYGVRHVAPTDLFPSVPSRSGPLEPVAAHDEKGNEKGRP
jgi:KaiC/GvpD/RAD55 family RecA-like ATPase